MLHVTVCVVNLLQVQFTTLQKVLIFGLLLDLALTLVVVPLLKFKPARWFGAFLFLYYIVFMVAAVLTQVYSS